jgi:hypothetical protein
MCSFSRVALKKCVLRNLVLALILSTQIGRAQDSGDMRAIQRIYVASFGTAPGASYLRSKLLSKLARIRTIEIVEYAAAADLIITGNASMRLVGYWRSNPRGGDFSSGTPVYDAGMSLEIEDTCGHILWSDRLIPRFWGSQYVSDNVVNQAFHHLAGMLR